MALDWAPILQGAEQEAFHVRLGQIAQCLIERFDVEVVDAQVVLGGKTWDYSVAGGVAGQALFFCHWYLQSHDPRALQCCNAALTQIASALAEGNWSTSLYGGLTGIGWTIDHVCTALSAGAIEQADELADLCGQIDDYLFRWLRTERQLFDYDLISGLVGIGVYCLARLPRESARNVLALIVGRLAEHAKEDGEGICWFTPAANLYGQQARTYPSGFYNLGLAHGIPGIIGFLARTHAAGIEPEESARLLRGAVAWLLSCQLPEQETSSFGTVIEPHSPMHPARLAWCYGDAGIAACLLAAADSLHDAAIRAEALRIARKAAARTFDDSGVADASFCHGAFGNAHIFNRLFQTTGELELAEAARRWLRNGAGMQQATGELCGFQFYDMGRDGNMAWAPAAGLLMGIAGIGLVTAAATSAQVPHWDSLFLVDLAPLSTTRVFG